LIEAFDFCFAANMIEKAGDGVFGEPWLMDGVSSLG
jgi:hypothetical protein